MPTQRALLSEQLVIAAKHLGKSVLILDIDDHHRNRTLEIFLGDDNVV